jgi:hypothetical protein
MVRVELAPRLTALVAFDVEPPLREPIVSVWLARRLRVFALPNAVSVTAAVSPRALPPVSSKVPA